MGPVGGTSEHDNETRDPITGVYFLHRLCGYQIRICLTKLVYHLLETELFNRPS